MSEEKLEKINTITGFMKKINKIKELERYKKIEKNDENTHKFTIDLFYRGHSNSNYQLVPSIERLNKYINFSIAALEISLIRSAKNEYPILFSETGNPLDLIVKLQHYGIPTRLLDITSNPLVALYFACEDKNNPDNDDKDGEIFIFGSEYEATYNNILVDRLIRLICRKDVYMTGSIHINHLFSNLFDSKIINTKDMEEIIKDNNCEEVLMKTINKIHFIYPPRLFERLYLQHGYFILFLNDSEYDDKKKILNQGDNLSPIPKDHKNIIARYIIPAKSKKHLLEELKMLNITESTLFHDDVDKVCKNIVADFKGRYGK